MRLTAKTRILIGQMGLLVSVLITAMMLRVIPDHRQVVLSGRGALCETLAITSAMSIQRGEFEQLEQMLTLLVRRNDDLLSVGVRDNAGLLMASVGDHQSQWKKSEDGKSTDQQVHIPLYREGSQWGSIEFRFAPVVGQGWRQYTDHPWARLIGFVTVVCTFMFYFYLRKMLQHLNPSKAVPQRVRSALDTLAEGLLVLDTKGQIVLANEAFSELVGIAPEKLVGRPASEFAWQTDQVHAPLPWVRSLNQQQPMANCALRLRVQDQGERIFNVNCSPVLGNTGKYRGVLVSFDDVTQLEMQRAELAKSKEVADAANRAKSDFLANMSHEIRTPMNAILGFADILRRDYGLGEAERQKYLNTIHSSGQHLLNLINDILDLSKVESGRLEVENQRCSPHEIMSDVVAVLRGRATEKAIRLDYRAEAIPEFILSDAGRLRQIVTNLVGNAIKFTEQGGVSIRARLVQQPDEPQLVIEIADTGIGMSPEQLTRIFDPFVQADASVTRRFGGTGLGLSISRRLARALGGDIVVTSEQGVGSRFTVTVATGPLTNMLIADSDTLESRRQQTAAQVTAVSRSLPGARVLLADDGAANRELLNLVLGRAGAQIDLAENGHVAVQLASRNRYDVVLMDMQMPVMDGFTATQIIHEKQPQLPIVALTADAMKGAEDRCLEAGCVAFVPKPIDMDQLFVCLKQLLQIAEQPEPQVPPAGLQAAGPPPKAAIPPRAAAPAVGADNASVLTPLSRQARSDLGLPEHEQEYRQLLETFLATLHDQLEGMIQAVQQLDYPRLAQLGHELKGTAPMFGYEMFYEPAERLEQAALKELPLEDIRRHVAALIELSERILRPPAAPSPAFAAQQPQERLAPPEPPARRASSAPRSKHAITSSLPLDDEDFRQIVVGFVDHLRNQVLVMQAAWQSRNFAQLAQLAHWLKGAGGTLGFDVFTEPARQLQLLANEKRETEIQAVLDGIADLVRRIQVPAAPMTCESATAAGEASSTDPVAAASR